MLFYSYALPFFNLFDTEIYCRTIHFQADPKVQSATVRKNLLSNGWSWLAARVQHKFTMRYYCCFLILFRTFQKTVQRKAMKLNLCVFVWEFDLPVPTFERERDQIDINHLVKRLESEINITPTFFFQLSLSFCYIYLSVFFPSFFNCRFLIINSVRKAGSSTIQTFFLV